MKIINNEILNVDFTLEKNQKSLPKNVFAIKVLNVDKNETFNIAINHNGYCPEINSENEESRFNDYLCALEYDVINEYFKLNKIKKPKSYYSIYEVITDDKGELYRYSKSIN